MTNSEKISIDIDKQVAAGFTGAEIKKNLLSQNYTALEIEQAFRQRKIDGASKPKPSGGVGILSLLVSVFFIIKGMINMGRASSGSFLFTWGLIMLILGILGVVWKSIDMARR
jgi:hypothetical protein